MYFQDDVEHVSYVKFVAQLVIVAIDSWMESPFLCYKHNIGPLKQASRDSL